MYARRLDWLESGFAPTTMLGAPARRVDLRRMPVIGMERDFSISRSA